MKIKKYIIMFFFVINGANAQDSLEVGGEKYFYKGGETALCKDYEILISVEKQRLEDKKNNIQSKIISNDKISSLFRVNGLAERVSNDKILIFLNRCD